MTLRINLGYLPYIATIVCNSVGKVCHLLLKQFADYYFVRSSEFKFGTFKGQMVTRGSVPKESVLSEAADITQ